MRRAGGLFLVLLLTIVGCNSGGGVPALPTDIVVTVNPGSITVSWSHSGQNVTGFTIFRDTVTTTGLTTQQLAPIGTVGATERSFEDTTAVPGTSYSYAVSADGEGGSSGQVESDAPVEAIQDPRVIDDTIANWNFGAADLVARVNVEGLLSEIARGTIAPNGQMSITLPATVPDELLRNIVNEDFPGPECVDSITVTPDTVRFAELRDLDVELEVEQGDVFIEFVEQFETVVDTLEERRTRFIRRTYFDVAVKAEGACNGEDTLDLDIDAPQGWSLLEFTDESICTEGSCSDTRTVRTVNNTDIPWTFD